MRLLVFHGYLLSGTGSNVYNARLAEALVRLGHEVHLLSQDRDPERHAFVDACGDWEQGSLRVRTLREPVRCTVYRPDIGPLLPVYVADRYEGIEARPFLELSDAELARYLEANVVAVRELSARVQPELALANHLVMGPVILARALAASVPYAVKIHGSALEYTVKAAPERFVEPAREGLLAARGVLVGSAHTAHSLWEALGDEQIAARTRLGPPGVDVAAFRPIEAYRDGLPDDAASGTLAPAEQAAASRRLLAALADRLGRGLPAAERDSTHVAAAEQAGAFARDEAQAARALAGLDPGRDRLVAFVGKLIVNKGADLLLAAWPLVSERARDARLLMIGFGSYRATLERLAAALSRGDLDEAREIAARGSALEDRPERAAGDGRARPLRYLLAFLDALAADEDRRERYVTAARGLAERTAFTGRLEHEELALVLPACEAVVVPSTFPESFGMIAVEAAACGALPVSAAHSGLEEVSALLARELPAPSARLLSFALGERAVPGIAECLTGWLGTEEGIRAETRDALVRVARERFSWEGVARGVIDAASGELGRLETPRAAGAFG